MAIHLLRLEVIGDNVNAMMRGVDDLCRAVGMPPLAGWRGNTPWAAEILGTDPKYKFKREFLSFSTDYARANSVGSRGVMRVYPLYSGRLYEVYERLTWSRSRRYFCRVRDDGTLEEIDEMEVLLCLAERRNDPSGSTSSKPLGGGSPGPSTPSPGST